MENRIANLPKKPPVLVESVTIHEGHIRVGQRPKGLVGDDIHIPSAIAFRIRSALQTPDTTVHYLTWTGDSDTPLDALIGDKRVANVLGGIVAADLEGNDVIGIFDRVQREGQQKQSHEMVVYVRTSKPRVTPSS